MRSLWFLLIWAGCSPATADEGLWPFNQFPKDKVLEKRQFDVPPDFLDHLRLASVRFESGSGSFVSPDGLILTNQQIAAACLAQLRTPQRDPVKDGWLAGDRAGEAKCPGLEAAVLTGMEDVTAKVKGAAADDTPAAQALERRNAMITGIEKECAAAGTRCTVVKLFAGGRYELQRYKTYRDLRLVFAPEQDLAFFGRERDAITYLRYGLNVAFLRAYEDGKPAATPQYLKWSTEAMKEGDLVFTSGNPLPTLRLATASQLAFYREVSLPFAVTRLQPRLQFVREFASKNEENFNAAQALMSRFLSEYKLTAGKLIGIRNDRLAARKFYFEGKVRRAVERDPALGEAAAKVWEEMSTAYRRWGASEKLYQLFEAAPAPGSTLFSMARHVVRLAEERAKPNAQRLPEYRDEALPALERALAAETPVNETLEASLLVLYLEELKHVPDKETPMKKILGGKTAQQAAEAYVKDSAMKNPAERKRLAGSREAIRASQDGMIRLALLIDEPARRIRAKRAEALDSLETSAADKIARYRLTLFGAAEYPDATTTPRVSYGIVKGYTDRAGIAMPFASSFGGLYYRRTADGPYQIPQRWVDLKPSLDLSIPLDFVSTCDVGGGDYGSPTVNRKGELVGVTFDGNLESLPNIYLYTDEQARAVHVAAQGIVEALEKGYKASALLRELGFGATAPPPATAADRRR